MTSPQLALSLPAAPVAPQPQPDVGHRDPSRGRASRANGGRDGGDDGARRGDGAGGCDERWTMTTEHRSRVDWLCAQLGLEYMVRRRGAWRKVAVRRAGEEWREIRDDWGRSFRPRRSDADAIEDAAEGLDDMLRRAAVAALERVGAEGGYHARLARMTAEERKIVTAFVSPRRGEPDAPEYTGGAVCTTCNNTRVRDGAPCVCTGEAP